LGEHAFSNLAPEEQEDIGFFVCFGCCMHKDMNAVKGGVSGMQNYWKKSGNVPKPVILPNKDNDAVLALAPGDGPLSLAEQHAITQSDSGAIKLCTLAGNLLSDKDDKWGMHDCYTFYFESKYGVSRCFPDTSNVRYGSFIDAATELLINRNAYIQFIEHCKAKKQAGTLNHLEHNVHKALLDQATFSELAVLSIYGQFISRPYMHHIRLATLEGKSIIQLGQLHSQVIQQLMDVSNNPQLLLQFTKSSSLEMPPLVGAKWSEPQVFTAIQDWHSSMPHLPMLLSEFCLAAAETWECFTQDLIPNGIPMTLSPEEAMKCFAPPTNDANEGALGTWCVWSR
jgi:hypothetical protein